MAANLKPWQRLDTDERLVVTVERVELPADAALRAPWGVVVALGGVDVPGHVQLPVGYVARPIGAGSPHRELLVRALNVANGTGAPGADETATMELVAALADALFGHYPEGQREQVLAVVPLVLSGDLISAALGQAPYVVEVRPANPGEP